MAGAQRGRGGCGRHAQRGRGGSHGFSAPRAPRQHGGPGLLGADPSSQPSAQVQPPVPVPLPSEKRDLTPPPPASSSPSSHVKASAVSDPVKNYNGDGGMTAAAKMDDDAQDDVLVGLSGSSTAATGKKRLLPLDNEEDAEDSSKKKTRLAWGEGLAKYENRQYKKDDETTHKLVAYDGATGETASSHGSSPPAGSKGHCDNNSLDHMAKIRVSHVTTAPGLFSKGSTTIPRTGDLSDPGKKESISSLTKEVVSPTGYIGDLPIIFPKVFAVPRKGSPPPEGNSSSSSGKTPIALSAFASSTQGCVAPPDESSMEFMKVQDAQKCLPTTVMQSQENGSNENDAAPLLSGIATVKATKNFEGTKAKEEDVKKPVNQIPHESTANLLEHSLPDKGHGESSMDENEHVTGKVLVGESNAAPSSLAMKYSHSDCLTISETEAPVLENFNEDSCSNEAVCITKSSSMVKENVPQSVLIANHGDEGNCVAGGSCGQDNLKITFFPDERSAKPASGTIEGDQIIRSGAKTVELCSSMKERNDAAKHHSWNETEKKLANSNIDDGKMAPSDMKRPNSKDNPCITSDPAAILRGPAFVQHMMELDEADESSMKFMKVQDVPPRMEKLIVKMVQNRKITNKNVLSDEPETDELQGSKLKEWSQEEKDVFSEMITIFGLNFSKVSSFLTHKTTADCMKYYSEHYKSECHKEAQKCLPTTVMQSQGNYSNENVVAPLLSAGTETVKATKNSERMKANEEVKKRVNKISHESTANLLAHSLRDKGHGESSMDENEHVTAKVVLGESNAAPSALGMRSSQAACLTISKTEAPVLENFNEDSCSNKEVCITKSSSKVKGNGPHSVLIANYNGDEGNCVAGGSCGHDTLKTTFFPDERSAKLAKGTNKGDQIRSGAKTAELCSSLKECNDAAKHHSGEATEKKLSNSNIDDGRMAPSDMKNPNSKDNPCITSDPAAILTGSAFVQHMMELDEAMEKKETEKNDDSVNGKEGNNPVHYVASKHGSGIQLSCEVNSQEMEKVDSIPSPEGNDLSTDTETLTKDSGPRVATNDDGLIQRLRASEAMYRHPKNNDAMVINNKENPVHSVALKESNGIQLSCDVTAKKGKGIIPSPEVNDLNAPPMQISYGAPNTYHLPSSSGSAALDMVHANSSYVAMDIDLNIPLDVTPIDVTSVDLRSSTDEAAMGCRSEATDSHTTMEITQTSQQQPASANQPGSVLLFGTVIHQGPPSTGTVVTSRNAVVPVIRPRGRGQAYASWATTTTIWRNSIPYGSSTNGVSRSAAPPLQLQPGSSASALINMMNQQRQQDLANIAPISIVRGGVPVLHSLIPGSSGGARFVNFNGFNSVQPQWHYPVVGTSRVVVGHPFYYPGGTANQAPATVTTILSIGTNNGEGASTSNARAPPAAGRGRGRGGHNSWLSLRRN